jgi:hypothetical protein
LAECNGFAGTFRCCNRKVDQDEISKNAYDGKDAVSKVLHSSTTMMELPRKTKSTACPEPWMLNSDLLSAFTIERFLSTDDLNDSVLGISLSLNITADRKFFGFEATVGW